MHAHSCEQAVRPRHTGDSRVVKPLTKQTNYQDAFNAAVDFVRNRETRSLTALGASPIGSNTCSLPVLNGVFLVDLSAATVALVKNPGPPLEISPLRIEWQILALHYLSAPLARPEPSRWISFADIADGRGYDPVYRARVISRLCATAGRDRASFVSASSALSGEPVNFGDQAFQFTVFPKLPVIIAWYQGDDEIGPGASFIYPDNITSFLPVEDIVVLSERLVARIQSGKW